MHWVAPSEKDTDNAARISSLSASQGDLRRLGSDERNLPHRVRQRPAGPTERARASHWAGVRCWPSDSADQFRANSISMNPLTNRHPWTAGTCPRFGYAMRRAGPGESFHRAVKAASCRRSPKSRSIPGSWSRCASVMPTWKLPMLLLKIVLPKRIRTQERFRRAGFIIDCAMAKVTRKSGNTFGRTRCEQDWWSAWRSGPTSDACMRFVGREIELGGAAATALPAN
jgi:hypothetical protein